MDDVKKGAEKWKDMSENDRCRIMAAECDGLKIETIRKSYLDMRTWQKKPEPKGMFNPDRYYRIAVFDKQSDADHVLSDDEKVLTVGNKVFDAVPGISCRYCYFEKRHPDSEYCQYIDTCHKNTRGDCRDVVWVRREDKPAYGISEDGMTLMVDGKKYEAKAGWTCVACSLYAHLPVLQCPYVKTCLHHSKSNTKSVVWKLCDNESAGLVPWDCASDVPDNVWLKSPVSQSEQLVIAKDDEGIRTLIDDETYKYGWLFYNRCEYRISGTTEWKRCGKVGTTANMP